MWMMILAGVALTAGFVFALRSQINAYRLGQAEERLRVKLDEYTSQQKFLTLDQQRALNTTESERAGRRNGLDQLKLDQPAALSSASIQRIVSQVPASARPAQIGSTQIGPAQAGQNNRLNGNRQNSARPVKQPVKPNSQEKAAKAARTAKAEKVVKSNAARSSMAKASAASNRMKASAVNAQKQSNNQRQASRSQQRR